MYYSKIAKEDLAFLIKILKLDPHIVHGLSLGNKIHKTWNPKLKPK